MTELSKQDLRKLHAILPAGANRELDALKHKLATILAERAGEREWGELVFRWTVPLDKAPTLNVYGSMKPWMRAKLYKVLDLLIMAELSGWPRCRARPGAIVGKRAVRVTRCSSVRPDEIGIDVIGGKVPVDRLVHAGILAGDGLKHLEREAVWTPAKPGQGSLIVEVYELA